MRLSLVLSILVAPSAAGEFSAPCAYGKSVTGIFEGQSRGDTFTLKNLKQRFVPADIVIGEVGGAIDISMVRPGSLLTLYYGEQKLDRYGRQPTHMYHRGEWLQGILLRKGEALALPSTQSRPCLKALLDAESKNTARRSRHWRSRGVEIDATDLEGLAKRVGQFALVTGIVRSVGDRERRLYLNFGENWVHDFTVSIAKRGAGKFTGDLRRLVAMAGRTVQIRGVLEDSKGPLIRVIDDVQIKIIK